MEKLRNPPNSPPYPIQWQSYRTRPITKKAIFGLRRHPDKIVLERIGLESLPTWIFSQSNGNFIIQIYNQEFLCGFGYRAMLERIGLESLPTWIFPQSNGNLTGPDL